MAIEWTADGIILTVRRFGETDCLVDIFTSDFGRASGFVKGGQGRAHRPVLQPGNRVVANWRSRLPDQLGRFTFEPRGATVADILTDPKRLLAIGALTATLSTALPDREPHPDLYNGSDGVVTLIQLGDIAEIAAGIARLDLAILSALGYGLDLSACAVTGDTRDLAYVSPKSGRAVSRMAAGPYADKLLRLPPFILEGSQATLADGRDALVLSQFFLDRHVWVSRKDGMPAGRHRFFERIQSDLAGG